MTFVYYEIELGHKLIIWTHSQPAFVPDSGRIDFARLCHLIETSSRRLIGINNINVLGTY